MRPGAVGDQVLDPTRAGREALRHALHTWTFSLTQLRRLRFPIRPMFAKELQQTDAECSCAVGSFGAGSMPRRCRRCDGTITLHRPYFYCDVCERGFHPVDAQLQLSDNYHQFDVQERTTRLGADLPFDLSADQFAHLTGMAASPHFIHDTLNGWARRPPSNG